MDELKPCPFCGGAAHIEVDDVQEPEMFWHYSPRCDDWGCLGHMFWFGYNTEEDAIEAWNTRQSHACYADEVTHRNCKYSVHRGWCEHTCRNAAVTPLAFRCGKCGWFDKNRCDFNFCPNCGAKVVE